MLPLDVVLKIRRLLDEGELTYRAIARRLGVGRRTVQRIANSHRGLHGRERSGLRRRWPYERRTPTRCPSCGGLVFEPCRLCRLQRLETLDRLLRRMPPPKDWPRCDPWRPR
jgi:hypothetical protein